MNNRKLGFRYLIFLGISIKIFPGTLSCILAKSQYGLVLFVLFGLVGLFGTFQHNFVLFGTVWYFLESTFIIKTITKNDQTKPKYLLSQNHMKFGMLKLDPNSTHHTKFEAIWRSFQEQGPSSRPQSCANFTNIVTTSKTCLIGPSNNSLCHSYKRCVSKV